MKTGDRVKIRLCGTCGEPTQRGPRARFCTPCRKKKDSLKSAAWQKARPGYVAAKNRRTKDRNPWYVGTKRQAKTDFIRAFKEASSCADCGGRFHPCCMDFDHIRGEKKAEISYMVMHEHSLEDVKAEMEKCELVCSNCHRLRTFNRVEARREARRARWRQS